MATTHQPLLDTPKTKISPCKALCVLLSIAAIVGPIAVFTPTLINLNTSVPPSTRICDRALDQASCWAMVSEVASESPVEMDSVDLLQIFLEKSAIKIRKVVDTARDMGSRVNDPKEYAALADCVELMDLSADRVTDSASALRSRTGQSRSDAHAWLSSVLTNHFTCMDGLAQSVRTRIEPELRDLVSRARAALAMVVAVSPAAAEEEVFRPLGGGFPSWLTDRDRRLLEARPGAVQANVVVAKDGSGKYKTVAEAVAAAPDNSKTRYVIYVKKGTYKENVEIGKNKKNLTLVGDGMDSTIITGSLNSVDGIPTFKTATVAAVGDGFIAQDVWFQNTAGPEKNQSVALRVGADQSVINRCRIDAYQDTLYAHSLRQFYRDSYITGTVDFIFGNAAVVIQNCQVVARKPMSWQNNVVTAQGREDPNQNTGTSIQNCNVTAGSDLGPVKGSVKTFLGRPWKEYSRTVFMQSYLGDHIDPAGWSPWVGDEGVRTLYYGEYMNKGPGSGTAKRVNWPGYHVITNAAEARNFTVAKLIQGGVWLKGTGVAYTEGL